MVGSLILYPIKSITRPNMNEKAEIASTNAPIDSGINPQVTNSNNQDLRNKLAEKMAGEITLSDNPGETLKKWRASFEISQTDLASFLKVSPSVISDYESGR